MSLICHNIQQPCLSSKVNRFNEKVNRLNGSSSQLSYSIFHTFPELVDTLSSIIDLSQVRLIEAHKLDPNGGSNESNSRPTNP